MLFLAMWTGDIMFANAYELIVFILDFIGIYKPVNDIFKVLGIEYIVYRFINPDIIQDKHYEFVSICYHSITGPHRQEQHQWFQKLL